MEQTIRQITARTAQIIGQDDISAMLFGSVVLNDFRLGWSDIDWIVLTRRPLSEAQIESLIPLRQKLLEETPDNPYFRLFEGGIGTRDCILRGKPGRSVYWGTSGQRAVERYELDPFSRIELIKNGFVICGQDPRAEIPAPSREEIIAAVRHHYETIRQYGDGLGWLLDTARCLYTLKTMEVTSKTAAEWALANGLSPDRDTLARALEIRKNPLKYQKDERTLTWISEQGEAISRFADILETALIRAERELE